MTPGPIVAVVLAVVLVIYVVTGGADFGGGLWDLLARGPRRVAQRRAIANAIAPIWEANHVWLVLAIVLTFVAFPRAYATIGTVLHVPLTLFLIGVVLRGAAFIFRAYDSRRDDVQSRWSVVFASASVVAPVLLGVLVGAIASGEVRASEIDFWGPWLAPFPWAVGLLTLAIFAFLAAVYLALETEGELREDFRRRGLCAAGAVFVLAWLSFFLSHEGAPELWNGLWGARWAIPFQLGVGTVGLGAIGALWRSRLRAARNLAVSQVVLVIGGWAAAQWPYVIPPEITVHEAAPDVVLWLLLLVLAIGTPPLLAAYVWLLRVFHARATPFTEVPKDPPTG